MRKHKRHNRNLRMKPRGRPHNLQRFRSRILNFGVFSSLAIFAVVAILFFFLSPNPYVARNGIPMNCSSLRASSSVLAVVTTDTFMPRALSTFM